MLGNLTQSNDNQAKIKAAAEVSLLKKISELRQLIDVINETIASFSDVFQTEQLGADRATISQLDANSIRSSSANIDAIDTKNLIATVLQAISIVAEKITATEVEANLKGQLLSVQNQFTALVGKIDTLNSTQVKAVKAIIDEVVTQSLTMGLLETNELGANNISSEFGRIKELKADNFEVIDKANIPELDTAIAHLGSVDADFIDVERAEVEDVVASRLETNKLVAPSFEGYTILNLDPQLSTQDDWYQLKILKGFDQFELMVKDSLDIKLIQSYVKNSSTKAATLAIVHQKDLNEVTLISEDDEYVYINISPENANELLYRYSTKDEEYSLKDFITFDYDGAIEYDWYYNPVRTSEIIVLGNSTEDYQFTILGKMVSAISPDFDNVKFDDITVSHNIFVKDYFDETLDDWVYKSGVENQYLSTINESFDEETQKWVTRIEWKHPVDNTEVGALELTDDSTEDILDSDGNKLGTRTIYGTKTRLVTANTVANWNGKVNSNVSERTFSFRPVVTEETFSSVMKVFDDMDEDFPDYYTDAIAYGFEGMVPYKGNCYRASDMDFSSKYIYTATNRFGTRMVVWKSTTSPTSTQQWLGIPFDCEGIQYENVFIFKGTGVGEYNPITKLGIVDEGSVEYKAGFVHTEELGIKNSIKWSNDTETEQKDYQVWLNGEEPSETDLDWVRR